MASGRAVRWIGAGVATAVLLWLAAGVLLIADAGWSVRVVRNVSPAMDSTLLPGETFTLHLAPLQTIHHEMLIAYSWPVDTTQAFVKRVVGLPGDTLQMIHGHLTRNGAVIAEPYVIRTDTGTAGGGADFSWQTAYLVDRGSQARYEPTRDDWGPLIVPADSLFILGDNRDNSLDSRYWGFVPVGLVLGVARRVYYSKDMTSGAIRWSRIGHRLN